MTASVPQKSLHVVQNTEWNVCSPAEALVANNRKHQLRVMQSRGFSSAAIAPIRTLTLWLTLIPSVELSGNKFPFSPWHWLCVVTGCSIESHIMCLGTLQRVNAVCAQQRWQQWCIYPDLISCLYLCCCNVFWLTSVNSEEVTVHSLKFVCVCSHSSA